MRTLLFTVFAFACYFGLSQAEYTREKRLIRYPFPGPRSDYRDENADAYSAAAVAPRVKRKPQYEEDEDRYSKESYPAARPSRTPSAQTYRPTIADPYSNQAYRAQSSGSGGGYQPAPQSGPSPSNERGPSSRYQPSYNARSDPASYGSANPKDKEDGSYKEENPEEEKKPSRLELLLGQSKFSCSGRKDGYYADASVNCQVFHYCVGGAKHSWQCPEGTVFHQVHLNCVPASQDICDQSEKFFVVNDYLHKAIDNNGPNNSIRYSQRYYPEEFLGDPLAAAFPASQSYPAKPQAPIQRAPPSGSGYNSYEDDYGSDDGRSYRPSSSSSSSSGSRGSRPQQPSGYSSYQPQPQPKPAPVPAQPPYSLSAKPYSGSGYSSSGPRSSYPSNDDSSERSYSRPTASPYVASTRSQYNGPPPSSSGYSPSSSSGYSPSSSSSPSSSYPPYKPASLSSPSPSYGYSRPSSYSSSLNPKSSSAPYSSYPSYSPYASSAYGSSAASERSLRPASYPSRGGYATNKPYGYSGVTYEEDY